jgi:hypothetical protein
MPAKFISGHVALDPVEFLENVQEVVEVFNSNIFHTKVIYNEAELDGTPFVAPEARGGFSFIKPSARRRDWRRSLARMPAWGRP